MHLLIVGFGSIGQRHLRVFRKLLPDARITVLSRHLGREGVVPDGADNVVATLDEALAVKPDAAVICGPASERAETALPLARAGVHLLLEKPIAATPDGVEDLLDAAKASDVIVLVGYVLRFHPVVRALKAAVDAGAIGNITQVEARVGQHLADWRPGRDPLESVSARADLGGGAILELSHEIDLVRWLAGDVASVSCQASGDAGIGLDVEDTADMTLRLGGGVEAAVHMDLASRPPFRTCRVTGEGGALEADLLTGTLCRRGGDGSETEPLAVSALGGNDGDAMFIEQGKHFLDCISSGARPVVTGADGLAVLAIALAAKRSAAEKGAEVAVPQGGGRGHG